MTPPMLQYMEKRHYPRRISRGPEHNLLRKRKIRAHPRPHHPGRYVYVCARRFRFSIQRYIDDVYPVVRPIRRMAGARHSYPYTPRTINLRFTDILKPKIWKNPR